MVKVRKVQKAAIDFLLTIALLLSVQSLCAQWRPSSNDFAILSEIVANDSLSKPVLDRVRFGMEVIQKHYDFVYFGKSPGTIVRSPQGEEQVEKIESNQTAVRLTQNHLADISKYFSKEDLEKILREDPVTDWPKYDLADHFERLFEKSGNAIYVSRPFYSTDGKKAIVQVTGKSFISAYIFVFENGRWVGKARISPFG